MIRASVAVVLALLLAPTCGCQIIGAMGYYLSPAQIQKPEFEFEKGSRVALLIETAQAAQDNPVFSRALHERVVTLLREGDSHAQLLPHQEVVQLRRTSTDFKNWPIQKIGRELGADYVLYIKLDNLVIRSEPDHPMLTPAVDLHMKLIDIHQPAVHARVWPEEREGREASCARLRSEAADANPDAEDLAARKLGYDTAYYVTMPFLTVDLEDKPPVEP